MPYTSIDHSSGAFSFKHTIFSSWQVGIWHLINIFVFVGALELWSNMFPIPIANHGGNFQK